jgi:hypothetical protein
MRIFRAIGLTLIVALAAAILPCAAAANQFHSSVANTTWTVTGNAVQSIQYEPGVTIECNTMGGSGETTATTTTELTFKPTYSGCVASNIPFSKAEVSMGNCDYLFTIEASSNSGPVHINCTSGQITITVKVFGISVCTLHIGEQTPTGVADYFNSGSIKVVATPTLTEMIMTRQGSEECGEEATSTAGSYLGAQIEWKGEEAGGQNQKAIQVG